MNEKKSKLTSIKCCYNIFTLQKSNELHFSALIDWQLFPESLSAETLRLPRCWGILMSPSTSSRLFLTSSSSMTASPSSTAGLVGLFWLLKVILRVLEPWRNWSKIIEAAAARAASGEGLRTSLQWLPSHAWPRENINNWIFIIGFLNNSENSKVHTLQAVAWLKFSEKNGITFCCYDEISIEWFITRIILIWLRGQVALQIQEWLGFGLKVGTWKISW